MLSDIEMFTLIASNPRDWLWSVRVQVEMFALLPKLWQRLDMTRRDELARIIIAGPPRDLYRSSLSEREWTEIRDHAIWARLSRIKRCDPGLRGVPLEGLERLEESYRWKLSGEQRDDFPLWMENNLGVRQGQRAEYLSKLSNDELVPILLTVRDRYDDTLEWWGAFVSEAPARGLTILTKLRTRGRVNLQVWSTALWSVQRLEERELKLRACELVRELSPRIRGKLLREIAGVIRGVSTKCDEGLRQTVIDTWDRVVATALGMKASSDREILSEALNHPAGVMAEALFEILRSGNLARNQGITQDIRKRLSRLSRSKGDGAPLARAIICSRLPLLHDLDPGWTVRYAIPLFDWGKPREAAGAWQGFLWSPLIRPSLWAVLKVHFLESFKHVEDLGEIDRALPTLLASLAIDADEALTITELGNCLRDLDHAGRASVWFWVGQKLEGSGERAGTLWRDRIEPIMVRAWPKEPILGNEDVWSRIAHALVNAGDAFPDAVEATKSAIGKVQHSYGLVEALRKQEIPRRYPEAALKLIERVIPEDASWQAGKLGEFLEIIKSAKPTLEGSVEYKHLREIVQKNLL